MRKTLGDRHPETLAAINKLGVLGRNPNPEGWAASPPLTRAELHRSSNASSETDRYFMYANET